MSEETTQETTQEQVDPFIDKAKTAGWRPLEEFEGDPEQWVDAKEFVKRAPLYEKNHKLKKKITDLENSFNELKGHYNKVAEVSYNRAMADLQRQRDEAIDLGDKDTVKEIDKAIKDVEGSKPAQDNQPHPAIKEWEDKNGAWFYADKEITGFGMAYANNYLANNPNDFEGAMESMEKAIKKAYPDKFENTKRKEPPAVEGGGSVTKQKTFTKSDLNDEQRKVMNSYVRNGVMTEEQYIKDLVEIGVLGGKK